MKDTVGILVLVGLAVSIVLTYTAGRIVGFNIGKDSMQKQAVENNCGYYDAKTAEFKWGKP
jgi:hypothetical protein